MAPSVATPGAELSGRCRCASDAVAAAVPGRRWCLASSWASSSLPPSWRPRPWLSVSPLRSRGGRSRVSARRQRPSKQPVLSARLCDSQALHHRRARWEAPALGRDGGVRSRLPSREATRLPPRHQARPSLRNSGVCTANEYCTCLSSCRSAAPRYRYLPPPPPLAASGCLLPPIAALALPLVAAQAGAPSGAGAGPRTMGRPGLSAPATVSPASTPCFAHCYALSLCLALAIKALNRLNPLHGTPPWLADTTARLLRPCNCCYCCCYPASCSSAYRSLPCTRASRPCAQASSPFVLMCVPGPALPWKCLSRRGHAAAWLPTAPAAHRAEVGLAETATPGRPLAGTATPDLAQ